MSLDSDLNEWHRMALDAPAHAQSLEGAFDAPTHAQSLEGRFDAPAHAQSLEGMFDAPALAQSLEGLDLPRWRQGVGVQLAGEPRSSQPLSESRRVWLPPCKPALGSFV